MFCLLSNIFRTFSVIVSLCPIYPTRALLRTIGPIGDPHFKRAVAACDGNNPQKFQFGVCSHLVDCVYDNVSEAFKDSMSSGTNIASLLPTILVLIGYPPLELVELAFLSPHRAIAACCFGIGLHSGLFRQLRPMRLLPSHSQVVELRVREWMVFLPCIGASRWQHRLAKITVDFIVVALLGIMLWRNVVVASFTMVPWRCEYTYMLLAWPLACIVWLFIAVVLLLVMKQSMDIYNPADLETRYSVVRLMSLPYTVHFPKAERQALRYPNGTESPYPETTPPSSGISTRSYPLVARQDSGLSASSDAVSVPRDGNYVTIRITMPSSFGWRSWRWYEAVIETLAVGVYLYATFVLTSIMFLNADNAMMYATVMALCLSMVRILTALF